MNKENYRFHITYDKNLTLKELSELLNRVNLSINDYYRDNGIRNNTIGQHSPIINKVSNGSILLEILIDVLSDLTVTLLAECIRNRFSGSRTRKNTNDVQSINVTAGNNNTINIYIENK